MTFKEAMWTSLISLVTGTLLGSFALLPSPINAVVSLLGVILVIWFFRKFERKGIRITFVIFTAVYYLLFILLWSAYTFIKMNPLQV